MVMMIEWMTRNTKYLSVFRILIYLLKAASKWFGQWPIIEMELYAKNVL